MIKDEDIPELDTYRRFEKGVPFANRADYENLVVFGKNDLEPIHNWFKFKEGYSAKLLSIILSEFADSLPKNELSLLDPYCGSGTTLLSAMTADHLSISAIGIERNPFIHFVAQTKCSWPTMDHSTLCADGMLALDASRELSIQVPSLSSLSTGRCISRYTTSRLMAVDSVAELFPVNAPFLRLGIAAAVEPLSKVRRDGRALRLTDRPRRKINDVLIENWKRMASDVAILKKEASQFRRPALHLGDGRNPAATGVQAKSVDLILTSPPYPNNIDYSEVYKLELWIMRFIQTSTEFLGLRHSTIRSHPTFNRNAPVNAAFAREVKSGKLKCLLGSVVERLEKSGEHWRSRLLLGYFSDMWEAIQNYVHLLTRNGIIVLVVGNSLHGTSNPALIATDLILAQIGNCHGLQARVSVARGLKRRLAGNHFLRESLVILRQPHAV